MHYNVAHAIAVGDIKREYRETKQALKKRYRNRVVAFSVVGGFCGVMSSVYMRDFADVTSLLIGVSIGLAGALYFGGSSYKRDLDKAETKASDLTDMTNRTTSMVLSNEKAIRPSHMVVPVKMSRWETGGGEN